MMRPIVQLVVASELEEDPNYRFCCNGDNGYVRHFITECNLVYLVYHKPLCLN